MYYTCKKWNNIFFKVYNHFSPLSTVLNETWNWLPRTRATASETRPTDNTEICRRLVQRRQRRHLVHRHQRRRLNTTTAKTIQSKKSRLSKSSKLTSTVTTLRRRFTRSRSSANELTWPSEHRGWARSLQDSTSWRPCTTKSWPRRVIPFLGLTPCRVRPRNWGVTTLNSGFSTLTPTWCLTRYSLDTTEKNLTIIHY